MFLFKKLTQKSDKPIEQKSAPIDDFLDLESSHHEASWEEEVFPMDLHEVENANDDSEKELSLNEKFRLAPTQLNALLQEISHSDEFNVHSDGQMFIKIDNKYSYANEHFPYFIVTLDGTSTPLKTSNAEITHEQPNSLSDFTYIASPSSLNSDNFISAVERPDKYIICETTKDSDLKDNQPELPYIGEVIEKVMFAEKTGSILIPVRLCDGFLGFSPGGFFGSLVQREHIMLVEVDLTHRIIYAYDSQSEFRQKIYPDCLKGIAKHLSALTPDKATFVWHPQQYNHNASDKQKDEVLCGYYVYHFILQKLRGGDCADVVLKTSDIKSKQDFFRDKDHANAYLEAKGSPMLRTGKKISK